MARMARPRSPSSGATLRLKRGDPLRGSTDVAESVKRMALPTQRPWPRVDRAAQAAGSGAASRVHPWRSPSGRRSRSGDAPSRPLQIVRVSHSHDHTFRLASSGTFTPQVTPLAQSAPAVAGSECRDHAPAPTLPGVPPGANQVNTPDHTPVCHAGHPHRHGAERRRSLANSRHGESGTTSQCDQEGRPVLPRRNGEP